MTILSCFIYVASDCKSSVALGGDLAIKSGQWVMFANSSLYLSVCVSCEAINGLCNFYNSEIHNRGKSMSLRDKKKKNENFRAKFFCSLALTRQSRYPLGRLLSPLHSLACSLMYKWKNVPLYKMARVLSQINQSIQPR